MHGTGMLSPNVAQQPRARPKRQLGVDSTTPSSACGTEPATKRATGLAASGRSDSAGTEKTTGSLGGDRR